MPALLPTSRRASATCRSHGLSRLKIKTVGPLGPAKVGCRGKSEGPAEAVSTPARAPGLAHLPGTWEGRAGLSHSEPLPLVCLSAPQTFPGQVCRGLAAACTALPSVPWAPGGAHHSLPPAWLGSGRRSQGWEGACRTPPRPQRCTATGPAGMCRGHPVPPSGTLPQAATPCPSSFPQPTPASAPGRRCPPGCTPGPVGVRRPLSGWGPGRLPRGGERKGPGRTGASGCKSGGRGRLGGGAPDTSLPVL